MESLEINDIDDIYWLASRYVHSYYDSSQFHVRCVYTSGDVENEVNYFCSVDRYGGATARSNSNGLRPVFTLKSGIKVTGGNGESGTPYTLGL